MFTEDELYDLSYTIQSMNDNETYCDIIFQAVAEGNANGKDLRYLVNCIDSFIDDLIQKTKKASGRVDMLVYLASINVARKSRELLRSRIESA